MKIILEADTGLRNEVRNELKREIKRQLSINGQETGLIQEAKADLREEEREKMRWEIKREAEGRHASEVRQLKKEIEQLESRLAVQHGNTMAGRFLEENSSVWSADSTRLAPTRWR
jgi:predicted transposase YdaD